MSHQDESATGTSGPARADLKQISRMGSVVDHEYDWPTEKLPRAIVVRTYSGDIDRWEREKDDVYRLINTVRAA